jgi:hypothetical protein
MRNLLVPRQQRDESSSRIERSAPRRAPVSQTDTVLLLHSVVKASEDIPSLLLLDSR